MRSFRLMALLAMCLMLLAAPVQAKTTITFWHGMGGELGEITDEMIKKFNASQDKYEVKGVYKGNYDEAMTAAIAAFRAKQHPNLIQIFEVGTASMMAAKGAIRPVYEIMEAAGTPVDTSKLLGSVASYYSSTDGKLIAMPFNASTTVLYYNKDAVKKAGGDPDHFPTTWPEVAELAKKIKESGACKYGLTSGWQSWVQLESFSAWHNVPFATNNNGYDGLDTKLLFNSPLHVKHIDFLSKLQKDGVMVYVGRKSEAINAFTSGEAGILMNSSGSYAAVKAGAKAIIVSNHGGRVLDQCPATAEVLPEIVDAVGKDVMVLVDGGIRTGMDVFKALALGARGVLIARPFVNMVYGGGEEGPAVLVAKLKAELEDTMLMCGAHSLAEIDRSMVR